MEDSQSWPVPSTFDVHPLGRRFTENATWNCQDDPDRVSNAINCNPPFWSGGLLNVSTEYVRVPVANTVQPRVLRIDLAKIFLQSPYGLVLVKTNPAAAGWVRFHSKRWTPNPVPPAYEMTMSMCCWDGGCTVGYEGPCNCSLPLLVDNLFNGNPIVGYSRCDPAGTGASTVPTLTPNVVSVLALDAELAQPLKIDGFLYLTNKSLTFEVVASGQSGFLAAIGMNFQGHSPHISAKIDAGITNPDQFVLARFNYSDSSVATFTSGTVSHGSNPCSTSVRAIDQAGTLDGVAYVKAYVVDFDPVNCPAVMSPTTGGGSGSRASTTGGAAAQTTSPTTGIVSSSTGSSTGLGSSVPTSGQGGGGGTTGVTLVTTNSAKSGVAAATSSSQDSGFVIYIILAAVVCVCILVVVAVIFFRRRGRGGTSAPSWDVDVPEGHFSGSASNSGEDGDEVVYGNLEQVEDESDDDINYIEMNAFQSQSGSGLD
jgi:hypothetical protein